METGNCIRECADGQQIARSKHELDLAGSTIDSLSNVMSLAGNGVRLKILYLLHNENRLCVCDITDILEMKTPAISQHLKKLHAGGIIESERVAKRIYYSLSSNYNELLLPLFNLIEKNQNIRKVS